jgi:hypothetical protein
VLGNFGKTISDCVDALKLIPDHAKSIFRAARASFALEKWEQAIEYCDRGLALNGQGGGDLLTIKSKAEQKLEAARLLEEKKAAEAKAKADAHNNLMSVIVAHGVRLTKTLYDIKGQYPSQVRIGDDGQLVWPAMFLYPEYNTSDFIPDFDERTLLGEQMLTMFPVGGAPPPWDVEGKYHVGDLRVLYERYYPPTAR